MANVSNKQLEAYRNTVTGIGWANIKQACLYTGIQYREMCDLVASGEIIHSRIGIRKVRIRYKDLDDFMLSKRVTPVDLEGLVDEVFEDLVNG